jgi:hypothetical protein
MSITGRPMSGNTTKEAFTEDSPLLTKKIPSSSVKNAMRKPEFLIHWLVPSAIYTVSSFLWAYAFLSQPLLCITFTVVCLTCCLGMIVWKRTELRGDRPWFPTVGTSGALAVIVGSFVGLYVYDSCIIFPQFYANSRKYTNVLPSQPAAAVSDAGKIVFASGTRVDTASSVGLVEEDGIKYCIAPVSDGSGDRVQFWAVGVGCCGVKGEFYCDESADSAAKSGIVVFENNAYFFSSNRPYYEKAMKKALAAFSLQSVDRPVYVRWVKEQNLNMLSNYYGWKGILSLLFGVVLYILLSLGIALDIFHAAAPLLDVTMPPGKLM